MNVAERALEFIADGQVVGLGTGRAATDFIRALGRHVQKGLHVQGVPTSQATADLAQQLGIPLTSLDEVDRIEVMFDGADEVDPQLDLIKGRGGALVREKIVAAASERLIILAGSEKLVPVLGTKGVLPIEVVPFAVSLCCRRLLELGSSPKLRQRNQQPFVTDNGNYILDCAISPLSDPGGFGQSIRAIPGVVETGLFLGMADIALIQHGEDVEIRQRGVQP